MRAYVQGTEYDNPPIDEAVVQLTFQEPYEWNVATPGIIYAAVRELYDQAPELQPEVGASLTPTPQGATLNFATGQGRVLYKNEAFDEFLLVSQQMLAVGLRAPYKDWPTLRSRLSDVIDRLSPLPPMRAVSVRYINRFEFPEQQLNTDEFFRIPVYTARQGQALFRSFLYQTECPIDNTELIRTTFATVVPTSGTVAFVLDLDLQHQEPDLSIERVLSLADHLKMIENEEFENSITEKMRARFSDGFKHEES